jgi:hypothetical protein
MERMERMERMDDLAQVYAEIVLVAQHVRSLLQLCQFGRLRRRESRGLDEQRTGGAEGWESRAGRAEDWDSRRLG